MGTQGTIADAGGDIAAVVYTGRDRPDLVLRDFAEHLTASGRRVCGLIQFRDRPLDDMHRRLMVLDDWQEVDIARDADTAGDSHCSLDGHWLDRMAKRAEASIRLGVDAVIVNRFGPLELAGRGFHDAIAAASETETPLVIAVPAFAFERWTRFSNGMTIRLDCVLDQLLDWWERVAGPGQHDTTHAAAIEQRACELLK
jgi:nucleoside-triphosphatase THEP1